MKNEETITKEDLNEWFKLREQVVNGWHLSDSDKKELIRLNHLVMEATHKIHNDHMLEGDNENVAGQPDAFEKLFNSLPKKDKQRL